MQGLKVAKEIHDKRGEGNALTNIGESYSKLGDQKTAADFHNQAIAILKPLLGEQHPAIKRIEKALQFAQGK